MCRLDDEVDLDEGSDEQIRSGVRLEPSLLSPSSSGDGWVATDSSGSEADTVVGWGRELVDGSG